MLNEWQGFISINSFYIDKSFSKSSLMEFERSTSNVMKHINTKKTKKKNIPAKQQHGSSDNILFWNHKFELIEKIMIKRLITGFSKCIADSKILNVIEKCFWEDIRQRINHHPTLVLFRMLKNSFTVIE